MLAVAVVAALLSQTVTDWLPAHVGDRWVYEVKVLDRDNGHPHVEAWQEEIKTVTIPEIPSGATQSWHLEAHGASGDGNDVWFRRHVGVVAKRTFHHGTYYDYRVRLIRFQAAK